MGEQKALVIAMVGLPRSGKSTIVKQLSKDLGAPIVRRDDIRLALHGQRYEQLAEEFVKAISDVMLRSLILSGHKVIIVDETNYSRAARERLKGPDRDVVFYEVPTPPEVCIERAIKTNQADLIGVIQDMWDRREPLGENEPRYLDISLARAA
jgi:predicted kinase